MIAYETDLEIISFRSNCYIPDAIMRNSAPTPPSSPPSQASTCRCAVDKRHDLV